MAELDVGGAWTSAWGRARHEITTPTTATTAATPLPPAAVPHHRRRDGMPVYPEESS